MANRRMFSKDIINSDSFLDLSVFARDLYIHLSMEADDRGYISNSMSVLRSLNLSKKELNQLVQKKFVMSRPKGLILIKGWKINNYIQPDRFVETKYVDDLKSLYYDENNSYTEVPTEKPCIQSVSKL